MELRDHPLMNYRGVKNWPPAWTRARGEVVKSVRGEVGVLKYVYSNALLSGRLYLIIGHENETYVGTLIFTDRAFCKQIGTLLNLNLNRSITKIGDLNMLHTL